MDLTIREIRQKQQKLKIEITTLLNNFRVETGVIPTGDMIYGNVDSEHQVYVNLKYSNPVE